MTTSFAPGRLDPDLVTRRRLNVLTFVGVVTSLASLLMADLLWGSPFAGWGVAVVGANCGNGPAEIERVMTEMSQAVPGGVVLMAKSNAGMPRWKDDRITYGGTPEVMAEYARKMTELGVRIVGGCCGSTPEHVAAMRKALRAGNI